MELEFAIQAAHDTAYPFELKGQSPIVIDWQPAILAIISDLKREESVGAMSARFHNMLVEAIVAVAHKIGEPKVVLSGGCFQNKYLTERAIDRLREENFRPYWHQRIPPNDGGISLGQIVAPTGRDDKVLTDPWQKLRKPRKRKRKKSSTGPRRPGEMVYEAIYAEGEHELNRNSVELALSGLAAGFRWDSRWWRRRFCAHLPSAVDAARHEARLQRWLSHRDSRSSAIVHEEHAHRHPAVTEKEETSMVGNVARLWAIVLCQKLDGRLRFRLAAGQSKCFQGRCAQIFSKIGEAAIQPGFVTLVLRGISRAG